jgi:hypothetical protein
MFHIYEQAQLPGFKVKKIITNTPIIFPNSGDYFFKRRKLYVKKKNSNTWSTREDGALLAANSPDEPFVTPNFMGRTSSACQTRYRHLVSSIDMEPWREHENELLVILNPSEQEFNGPPLPGRSTAGCINQLARLRAEATSSARESVVPSLSFTSFNQLPPELRVKIWEMACCGPRIVEVHPVGFAVKYSTPHKSRKGCERQHTSTITHLRSRTSPPALLHVCCESRRVAQRMYKNSSLSNQFVPDSIYFESAIDTLYITKQVFTLFGQLSSGFRNSVPFIGQHGTSPRLYRQAYVWAEGFRFPPHTPAGLEVVNIRSLAVNILWLIHPSSELRGFNCQNLHQIFFYLSSLEEIVLIVDKSYQSLVHDKGYEKLALLEDSEYLEQIRSGLFVSMEDNFSNIEKHLNDDGRARYSRIGKPMPSVRIDLTSSVISS